MELKHALNEEQAKASAKTAPLATTCQRLQQPMLHCEREGFNGGTEAGKELVRPA